MENERYSTMNSYDLARKLDELLRQTGFISAGMKRKTGKAHKKYQQYCVERDNVSLTAILYERDSGRKDREIEIIYRGPKYGQCDTYRNGNNDIFELDSDMNAPGYDEACEKLGPELRRQIPSDWLSVLGKWPFLEEQGGRK